LRDRSRPGFFGGGSWVVVMGCFAAKLKAIKKRR
jgi:hypothetical protein